MTLDDCQRLRARLEEKYKADLEALERVEEMLLAEDGLNGNGTVAGYAKTKGTPLRETFQQALETFDGEFTVSEIHEKVAQLGCLTLRQNVKNYINNGIVNGTVELIGQRKSGTAKPTHVYRRVVKEPTP